MDLFNVLFVAVRGLATVGIGASTSAGFGIAAAAATATVVPPVAPLVLVGAAAGVLVTGGAMCLAVYLRRRPERDNPVLLAVMQNAVTQHVTVPKTNEEKSQNEKSETPGANQIHWPTPAEINKAMIDADYQQQTFHFAVAGAAGSGKSSLINSFRGLRNRDTERGAAATGSNETTLAKARYPDPSDLPPRKWTVWYDIPGAGTQSIPDWQYFNQQGLFIYDAIIVAFNDRFTLIDLGILRNCEALGIPAFIVRTKADAHIRNILQDQYGSDDEEEGHNYTETNRLQCQEEFVAGTKTYVAGELERAGLDQKQRVYVVSKDKLRAVVCAVTQSLQRPKNLIDEEELYIHLLTAATGRRCEPEHDR